MSNTISSKFDTIYKLFPSFNELRRFYDVMTKIETKIVILDLENNPPWEYSNKPIILAELPYGFGCLDFPIIADLDLPALKDLYKGVSYDDTEYTFNYTTRLTIDADINGLIKDKLIDPLFVTNYKMIYLPIRRMNNILYTLFFKHVYKILLSDLSVTFIMDYKDYIYIAKITKIFNIPIYEFKINYNQTNNFVTLSDLEPTQYRYEYFSSSLSNKALQVWNERLHKWTHKWWKPNGKLVIKRMEDSMKIIKNLV